MNDKPNIAEIIATTPGFFVRGPLTNATGYTLPFYVDMRPVLSFPEKLSDILVCYTHYLYQHDYEFDIIAGAAVSGLMLSAPLAYVLRKKQIVVRKAIRDIGRGVAIEGYFEPGQSALLVDDATSNGEVKKLMISHLEEAGISVSLILTPFARDKEINKQLTKETGVQVDSLCDLSDVIDYAIEHLIISKEAHTLLSWYLKDPAGWKDDKNKWNFFQTYLKTKLPEGYVV